MTLRPLAGTRVLEVGSDMSMSFGCRLLADLGAEVIKIEPPGDGDPIRREGPLVAGEPHRNNSALFGYLNAGKQSVTLDVDRPSGHMLLERLMERSDIVAWAPENVASPALARHAHNGSGPGTVVIAVSAYGVQGPGTDRVGTPFVVQHAAGFALHQACPVSDPHTMSPVACADREAALTVGLVVAVSAVWGLEMARTSNVAPFVDVSFEDVFAYMLVEPFAEAAAGRDGFTRQREPGSGTAVIGGLVWYLPCADGAVLVSPREDHQWANWMEVMGRPDWASDADLCASREVRTRNAEKLQKLMAEWSVNHRAHEIFNAAQAQRVACFPISTPADLLNNPQLDHRRFFSRLRFPNGAEVAAPGLPFIMEDSTGAMLERGGDVAAPALGGANERVWQDEFGLPAERSERFARYGLI